jgi:hypothetical protein
MEIRLKRKRLLLVSLIVLGLDAPAHAADINAASCSQADVQAAINAAVILDTVIVPAGDCTWTSTVSIPPGKKITLRGAGAGVTKISGAVRFLDLTFSGSRVTGFRFTTTAGSATMITVKGQGWRIHHNEFINATGAKSLAIQADGLNTSVQPQGVIDQNTFEGLRVLVFGMGNFTTQSQVWAGPLGLGTDNAVFVEDNTFRVTFTGNIMDTNRGGRYVFRHNTVNVTMGSHNGALVEVHSKQSLDERGSRSWEIYENTFNASPSTFTVLFIRGGTGVAFNNRFTTNMSGPGILLDNVRTGTGECDGTDPIDSNEGVGAESGWLCRDQIGASTDSFLWTPLTPSPPQAKEPAYFWGNTKNGLPTVPEVSNTAANHIKLGRDVVHTPKPGYTPFTYPHPLRSETRMAPPAAPTDLRISNFLP